MNLVFNQFSSWKAPLSYVNITFSCDSSTFLTWIVYLQRLKFTRKETEIEKKERIADFIHPDDGGYLCEDNHSSMLSVPRSLQNRKLDSWQKLTYVVTSCFKIWLHSAAAEQEKRARAVLHKNLFPNQMTHSGRKFYWDPGKKKKKDRRMKPVRKIEKNIINLIHRNPVFQLSVSLSDSPPVLIHISDVQYVKA